MCDRYWKSRQERDTIQYDIDNIEKTLYGQARPCERIMISALLGPKIDSSHFLGIASSEVVIFHWSKVYSSKILA
jgi:hypothetical protein